MHLRFQQSSHCSQNPSLTELGYSSIFQVLVLINHCIYLPCGWSSILSTCTLQKSGKIRSLTADSSITQWDPMAWDKVCAKIHAWQGGFGSNNCDSSCRGKQGGWRNMWERDDSTPSHNTGKTEREEDKFVRLYVRLSGQSSVNLGTELSRKCQYVRLFTL